MNATRRALPPDQVNQEGFRSSYQLKKEGWQKLAGLAWDKNQSALVSLLRANENGPLHISEITEEGIVWQDKRFPADFNKFLKANTDEEYSFEKKRGWYYRLHRPQAGLNAYAIIKHGYFGSL